MAGGKQNFPGTVQVGGKIGPQQPPQLRRVQPTKKIKYPSKASGSVVVITGLPEKRAT